MHGERDAEFIATAKRSDVFFVTGPSFLASQLSFLLRQREPTRRKTPIRLKCGTSALLKRTTFDFLAPRALDCHRVEAAIDNHFMTGDERSSRRGCQEQRRADQLIRIAEA